MSCSLEKININGEGSFVPQLWNGGQFEFDISLREQNSCFRRACIFLLYAHISPCSHARAFLRVLNDDKKGCVYLVLACAQISIFTGVNARAARVFVYQQTHTAGRHTNILSPNWAQETASFVHGNFICRRLGRRRRAGS